MPSAISPGRLQRLLRRLGVRRDDLVYVREASVSACPMPPALPGMEWVEIDANTLDARLASHPFRAAFSRLLATGAIGIALMDGSEWAAHAWMSTPTSSLPHHVPRSITPRYWIHFCRTQDAYRGRGLYPLAIGALLATAARREHPRAATVYIDTATDNVPSRRGIARAGFVLSEIITTFGMPQRRLRLLRLVRRRVPSVGDRALYLTT